MMTGACRIILFLVYPEYFHRTARVRKFHLEIPEFISRESIFPVHLHCVCLFRFSAFDPVFAETRKRESRRRHIDIKDNLRIRLNNAKEELKSWAMYDYLVVNDDIRKATRDALSIIDAYRCSRDEIIGRIPWLQKIA